MRKHKQTGRRDGREIRAGRPVAKINFNNAFAICSLTDGRMKKDYNSEVDGTNLMRFPQSCEDFTPLLFIGVFVMSKTATPSHLKIAKPTAKPP